jgi:glycosyltransferase involved in cell wall biosynthesis
MKDKNLSLSVIIITYNEEQHIVRCINSAKQFTDNIIVVDSFSIDKTVTLAKENGVIVYQNKWPNNHSKQVNWALDNCDIQTKWVMRLDADEIITPELSEEIAHELLQKNDVKGYILNRGHYFFGRKILHGGNYPIKLLRIWEFGLGYCEDKLMDEHIILSDDYEIKTLKGSFWDYNLNNITWWTEKHNSYSTKEAIMQLRKKYNIGIQESNNLNKQSKLRRFLKHNIYENFPISLRSLFYFIYRYVLKGGFLDGYPGLVWNCLQGFWYRFLVDVKVYEIEKKAKENNLTITDVIKNEYGYDL